MTIVGDAARYNINVADGDGLDSVVNLVGMLWVRQKLAAAHAPIRNGLSFEEF